LGCVAHVGALIHCHIKLVKIKSFHI
jgi:hypothetical protein